MFIAILIFLRFSSYEHVRAGARRTDRRTGKTHNAAYRMDGRKIKYVIYVKARRKFKKLRGSQLRLLHVAKPNEKRN